MPTPGADSGQLGEPRYFQSPGFILTEMEVHHVHLMECEEVQYFHHLLLGLEITRYIQHHRAVRKPRLVREDRKSVVEGKSVCVRVDLGGRRIIKRNKQKEK